MSALIQNAKTLVCGEAHCPKELHRHAYLDIAFLSEQKNARYVVGFAVSQRSMEEVFRLRYQVFNQELGEGLVQSHLTGMDRDPLDEQMSHLVVVERATGEIVGTYRLQTIQAGLEHAGVYSAQEYDLGELTPYFSSMGECGRACIAREHRSAAVLLLLWAGLRDFMRVARVRWMIGCCSLTSQNVPDGWRALHTLRERDALHQEFYLPATAPYSCGPEMAESAFAGEAEFKIPKLFGAYLRLGAHVISEPAIDRDFGTIDFLIMQDGYHMNHMQMNGAVA